MKHFFFVIFFMIPSLVFALNEKECNQYFNLANQEFEVAKTHVFYAEKTQVEMKIFQLNAAMQSLHRAVLNLDIVLNAIHALKSHKLRPWHRTIKEKCKRQKEICFRAANEIQNNLAVLSIMLPIEQNQNEGMRWTEIANAKAEESKSLSGQPKLDSLNEALIAYKNAFSFLENSLLAITLINDQEIRRQFVVRESSMGVVLKNFQDTIANLENSINHHTFGEEITTCVVSGNLKFQNAESLKKQTYLKSLKDIPECLVVLQQVIALYENALSDYKQAYQLVLPSQRKYEQGILKEKIDYIEQTVEFCKLKISGFVQGSDEIKLKEQLAILEINGNSLNDKKKIKAILEELVDAKIENSDVLNLIQNQITNLEFNEIEIPRIQTLLTDDEFTCREKIRREVFYNKVSNILNQIGFEEEHCASVSDTVKPSYPFVHSLEEIIKNESGYLLSTGQFYHFYIQNKAPPSFINIDVIENANIIHTEKVSFPIPSQSEWDDYIIYEGLVRIPETPLTSKFGLDIQLIIIPKLNDDYAFIIKHKCENQNYQFAFSCDESSLYTCSLIESPPWQLQILRDSALNAIGKPFGKTNPSLACMENASSPDGIKHTISHPIILHFIEEMKNDPLALAQYVQNEIDFISPCNRRVNSVFGATKIQRSALGTFLDKKGSPWEQCALLVYLLRNAGYEAFYADGATYTLPAEYIEKLLTIKLPGEERVLLDYPWVIFNDGSQWISLFPWMKDIKFHQGYNLYDFLPKEYASAERWIQRYLTNDPKILQHIGSDGDDTAGVLFVRFVENELRNQGLTLDDVGIHRFVNKKQYNSWEQFPRVTVTQDFDRHSDLYPSSNLYMLVDIIVSSRENPKKEIIISDAFISDLITNPYTIGFQPEDETDHVLNLKQICTGKIVNQLHLDQTDFNINIKIAFKSDDLKSQTFTISKGTCGVICFNNGGSNSKISSYFGDIISKADDDISKLHALLSFTGALYFDKCSKAEANFAKLHKTYPSTILNFGIAKLSPDISNGAITGEPDLRFPQVDMMILDQGMEQRLPFASYNNNELAKSQMRALKCVDTSSNEHQVLREIFNDPYAISTVKLLQIAHEQHHNQGLSGLGFLSFTNKSLIDSEQTPIFSQCFYFNHLKNLNLSLVKAQARKQWDRVSQHLKNKDLFADFSYAYMTPRPISSKDGNGITQPSYTGMGTLIIHNDGCCALISSGDTTMNGGYGSRLADNALFSFIKNDWKIIQKNNSFSLITPNETPFVNEIDFSIKTDLFSVNEKSGSHYSNAFHHNADISDIYIYDHIKSDIRQNFKSDFYFVADPVDTVSGAFYIDELDLSIPGPFPLEVRRNYNNQNPISGALGFGWKISLNPYLVEKDGHLFAAEQDGTLIDYRLNKENGRWEVYSEDNPELLNNNRKGIGGTANPYHAYIENVNGYILHGSDGSKRRFDDKLLKEWTDANGNSLIFVYNQERLIRIENSQGGFLGFYYNHEGRISEAYTRDGRRIYYNYNSEGNLIRVELPNGGNISYEYDSLHQITKETKPHGRFLINVYDDMGRVIEQCSPNGRQQQVVTTAIFAYGDNINTATDAAGACTEYKIFNKQIYKITDPEGNQILQSSFIDANTWFDAETEKVMAWDGDGGYPCSLKSIKDKRGLIKEYRYDQKGNPIQITLRGKDLTGNGDQEIIRNQTYDEHNLCVLEQVLNNKTVTKYDFDHPYLPKRVEKYSENTLTGYIELEYNRNGQVLSENNSGAITLWEYDQHGFPRKKTQKSGSEDPDVETLFLFNHQGQCIENTSSDAVEKNNYDIMGNLYLSSVYDLSGDLISEKYAHYDLNNALTWQMGSDPHDITFIDYNAAGQPKAIRQHLSKASIDKTQSLKVSHAGIAYSLFEYDFRGHLTLEVDPNGNCTYRDYDQLGRVSHLTRMDATTTYSYEEGGLLYETTLPNQSKSIRRYATNGLLINESYPDGTEITFKYDLLGRPISETKDSITTTIEYDDLARKVIHKQNEIILKIEEFDLRGNLVVLTDALGHEWKKSYDGLNRLKCDIDPYGNETTWQYRGDTIICTLPTKEQNIQKYKFGKVFDNQTFDSQGKLIAHSQIEHYPQTSSFNEIKGNNVTTTWMNTQGKPIAVKKGEVFVINYFDPCGHCVATKDGEGRTALAEFDPLGRLRKKALSGGREITYDYDQSSNLIACNLPGGNTWKASYDSMGRKLSEELCAKDLASLQWTYVYKQGRLVEATDPNLLKHLYSYDIFGRMIEDKVGEYSRRYIYDLRGSLLSAEQITQENTKLERNYDANGRISSESITLNSQLIQKTFQSWEPGQRTLQIEGHQRCFSYLGGHLNEIATPEITLKFDYGMNGALANRSKNRHSTSFNYNASSLPKTIASQINGQQYIEALEWDKSGKMQTYQSNFPEINEVKSYIYNLQGQLKSINEDVYRFDFDQIGCGVRTESPHWNVVPNGLDPFGKIISEISNGKQITTSYNPAGQVISRFSEEQTQNFKWDPWGNLVEINCEAYTWSASYDPLGRRLQTIYKENQEADLVTTSLYDPEKEFDEIGVKYDNKTFWKLIANGTCNAIIDEDGNSVDLIYDALDSLVAVVDNDQVQWSKESFSPYGPCGLPTVLEANLISLASAHAWQSRRIDPTGFIWMGARYYDPTGGKFLSSDPVGIPISLNLYSYANGDPINFNDPDGRFASAVYATSTASMNFAQSIVQHNLKNLSPNYLYSNIRSLGTFETEVYVSPGRVVPDKKLIYTNGILTPFNDAKKVGNMLSELSGGYQVHVVYNPTTMSPVLDGLRWCLGCKFGYKTDVVRKMQDEMDSFFRSASKDATLMLIGFSEGVTSSKNTLKTYNPDLRLRVDALVYCPSAYINANTCRSVIHYCSENDIIHKLVSEGFVPGRQNVVFLPPDEKAGWIDHAADSPTFKDQLKDAMNIYFNQ